MDAVFLEVWQRAGTGYEIPDALIEPALGGPDTAERLHTSCAFRLARLAAGQTPSRLSFSPNSPGALPLLPGTPSFTTAGFPLLCSRRYTWRAAHSSSHHSTTRHRG